MDLSNVKNKEGGFTLVELAIVMIIIGLLIAGILKGQELIANSQVTATIAQVKGLEGAASTFRDKYSALPGDIPAPDTRLPCGANCVVGAGGTLGDGRIEQTATPGAAPAATEEGVVAMSHMASADLISGVTPDNTGTLNFGSSLPESKIGGGYWIGFSTGALTNVTATVRPGHYLILNGTVGVVDGTSGGLDASQAAQIDRKMDDGIPDAGTIVTNDGTNCIDATTGGYDENDRASLCALYMRFQS